MEERWKGGVSSFHFLPLFFSSSPCGWGNKNGSVIIMLDAASFRKGQQRRRGKREYKREPLNCGVLLFNQFSIVDQSQQPTLYSQKIKNIRVPMSSYVPQGFGFICQRQCPPLLSPMSVLRLFLPSFLSSFLPSFLAPLLSFLSFLVVKVATSPTRCRYLLPVNVFGYRHREMNTFFINVCLNGVGRDAFGKRGI